MGGLGFFHRCALKRDGKGKCTYGGGCGTCPVWKKKMKTETKKMAKQGILPKRRVK